MKDSIFVYIYGYLPGNGYGGPVSSIYNFTQHFGDKYDIRIVCSNHDHGDTAVYSNINPDWNPVGKANVMYLSEKEYGVAKFCELMKPYNVKMAYLTGVFPYPINHPAMRACDKLNIPVVIATRGEILTNILAMKKCKKVPYLHIMRMIGEFNKVQFQVTSDEEVTQLKKYLHIPDERITMLPNIHGKALNLPRPEKKVGEARFIFISRIHPKKNLLDAIEGLTKANGEILFDIYGPIEDEAYWKTCQEMIKKVPDNVKISYKGPLNLQEARESYYGYHAFLFPTLSENYGHVIVESLIAECPVIISRETTPWDDLDGIAGYVVKLHDIPALTEAINKIVAMNSVEYRKMRESLNSYRDRKLNLDNLIEGYERLISNNK